MYELSTIYPAISGAMPEWAWDCAHDEHRRRPAVRRHFTATFPATCLRWATGVTAPAVAWLAARVLLRHFQGAPDKGDELLGLQPHPQVTNAARLPVKRSLVRHAARVQSTAPA